MAWRRAGLMRGWSCSARETVEGATPAAAAMSVMETWFMVDQKRWFGTLRKRLRNSKGSIAERSSPVKKGVEDATRGKSVFDTEMQRWYTDYKIT